MTTFQQETQLLQFLLFSFVRLEEVAMLSLWLLSENLRFRAALYKFSNNLVLVELMLALFHIANEHIRCELINKRAIHNILNAISIFPGDIL